MDFYNSLTLDLKLLLVGIAGCVLLALFSGNAKTEKRYVLILALLTIGGVYRFTHLPAADDHREARAAASSTTTVVTPARKAAPLSSTSGR